MTTTPPLKAVPDAPPPHAPLLARSDQARTYIALRIRPFWRPAWLAFLFGAGVVYGVSLTALLLPLLAGVEVPRAFVVWLALPALGWAIAALVAAIARRPGTPLRIELFEDALIAPSEIGRIGRIPYRDIAAVHPLRFLGLDRVVLAARGRYPIVYSRRQFAVPGDLERLIAEVRRRLACLSDGAERLAELDRRAASARAMAERVPALTIALALAVCAVFLLELRLGALESGTRLIEFGANAPALVAQGEVFRLVTANFLHHNGFHFGVNLVTLLVFGTVVESMAGPSRLAVTAASGALGGSAASAWLGLADASVGASAAITGIAAAWLLLFVRFRDEIPGNFLFPGWLWVLYGVLALAGEVIFGVLALEGAAPRPDHAAHAGGLAAGLVAAFAATPRVPLAELARHRSRGLRVAVLLLTALFAAGLAGGLIHACSR